MNSSPRRTRRSRRRVLALTPVVLGALVLSACSGTAPAPEASGPVSLTVGNLPPASNEAARKVFLSKVDAFEAAHPDITIEASETTWDPQTFAAQLAGGSLPTVISVPLTELQGLISRQQVKDISSSYETNDALKVLNPATTVGVQDGQGAFYGIPTEAYTLGLLLNRSVFEKAGLDPDTTPLSTWDDVVKAATQISQKTDAAGYAPLATTNQGGWTTAAIAATYGSLIEEVDGDSVTATLDSPGVVDALTMLKKLRWSADAVGENYLLDFNAVAPLFASGAYGIMVGASGWYSPLVITNGMKPDDFGLRPLPQTSDSLGNLGGGAVNVVKPTATEAETAAAVEWTTFYYLNRYTDLDFAKQEAASRAADGAPVPSVGLPLVNEQLYASYLDAIQPDVNVPLANIAPYQDAVTADGYTIVAEPKVEAQQLYGLLDAVVQAVLTDENTDIAQALATAQAQAESIVAAAQ